MTGNCTVTAAPLQCVSPGGQRQDIVERNVSLTFVLLNAHEK